jgi:L-asparaginase II
MFSDQATCPLKRRRMTDAARKPVSTLSGVPEVALVAGVDGCSAPNYAVPLSRRMLEHYSHIRLNAKKAHSIA